MGTPEALNVQDITKVGVIVIVALLLIGVVLSFVITALIGRLIIAVVVIVLAVLVWQQRTHVKDQMNAHKCDLKATFFGIHLDAPDSVRQACKTNT
jgi:protein-S-isoprenylcysteine O-methyltransferase Ste14